MTTNRVLTALCVAGTIVIAAPSFGAAAADAGPATLRGKIGADGKVESTAAYAADGTSKSFGGALPLALTISRTGSDGRQTFGYHVENTSAKDQTVTWTDLAGKSHSVSKEVALPLVGQLGVTLPASYKDISAPGATITKDADGTHLLWQLVLFAPIGSPTLDVSFTAKGAGEPTTQLLATAVDPGTAPGISGTQQAANEVLTQGLFWHGFAAGGNDGLTALRAGVAKMVAGLTALQTGSKALNSGLVAAGKGAAALDKGGAAAKSGGAALSNGLTALDKGAASLSNGLKAIDDGQGALTTGLGQVSSGQTTLTNGLGTLSGGLAALSDPATGLPAASAGLAGVDGGLQALLAGLGSDASPGTILNGTKQIADGLASLHDGVTLLAGCTADVLDKVIAGAVAGTADACFAATGGQVPTSLPGVDAASAAVLVVLRDQYAAIAAGTDSTLTPAFTALTQGLALVRAGLSHPAGAGGASDPGGFKEGLAAVSAGVGLIQGGLAAAVNGVTALSAGAQAAYQGSQALGAGIAAATTGAQQLDAGTGVAYDGSVALSKGATAASNGGKALVSGLTALAAGQHALSTGLPAAVTGSGAIAAGSTALNAGGKAVATGLGAAQTSAFAPLQAQIDAGASASGELVATLQAAVKMTKDAPGGEGASYVLASEDAPLQLVKADSGDSTNPAVVAAAAIGGALLLLTGLGGGFVAGRRRSVLEQ